ncbi:MAG: hypothetical protein GXP61_05225 [Epsilonproteobacteria bacterium]|nr:hypothetical protein [Campylobacterota bacterium]
MSFSTRFLSFFREIFVYHHKSLEFRAKVFASMIASNKKDDNIEYEILRKIAKEIYKDEHRINVLVETTKEYVEKIINVKSLNIDSLIIDINKEIRLNPRFIRKINIRHLKSFLVEKNHTNEDTNLLQRRIIEYFKNEMKYSRQK